MSKQNQNIISRIVKKWTKPAILMAALAVPAPLNTPPENTPEDLYAPSAPLTQAEIIDHNMNIYHSYLSLGHMSDEIATIKTCETSHYQRWDGLDIISEKGGPMGKALIDFLNQNNIQICVTPDAAHPPEPLSASHRIISISDINQDFSEVVDHVFNEIFHLVEDNYLETGIKSISGLEYYMRLQSTNFILKAEIARHMEQEKAPELAQSLQEEASNCSLSDLFRLSIYDYKSIDYTHHVYEAQKELSRSGCFNYNAAFDNFSGHDLKQTLAAKERELSLIERFLFKQSKTDYIKERGLLSDSDILRGHSIYGGYDVERAAKNIYLDQQAILAADAGDIPDYKEKLDHGHSLSFAHKYLSIRPESIVHTMENGTLNNPVKHSFKHAFSEIYNQYHDPQFVKRTDEISLRAEGCTPSSTFAQYSIIATSQALQQHFTPPATILTDTIDYLQNSSGLLAEITQSYMQNKKLFFCLDGEDKLGKGVAGSYAAQSGVVFINEDKTQKEDLADTVTHEIVHYVQDMHGLLYFDDNWSIYDHQSATLSIEAAAKSLDLLFSFERELQGNDNSHIAHAISGTPDEPIYRAIKETYDIEREFDTPHKEAMRIAGEAGFYSFSTSPFHTDFYNKRVASFYLKLLSQNQIEFPLQENAKRLYYTQKSGSFAEDFNITADIAHNTMPDFSGQNDKIISLFRYIDHYTRTRQNADKSIPHQPQLSGNPYSGVDLIAFQKYFIAEHNGDAYLLLDAMDKWQNLVSSPVVKAKNTLKR